MENDDTPIGPISQVILNTLWVRLWDASSSLYLPTIIKNGSSTLGLPVYDPVQDPNRTDLIPIPGVPADTLNSACSRDVPISPIATGDASLGFANLKFEGLSFISPIPGDPPNLTFSKSSPVFTAIVTVGTQDHPFMLSAWDGAQANYYFQLSCCEPVAENSAQCSNNKWTVEAKGCFTATLYVMQLTLTVQLNTTEGQPLSITMKDITIQLPYYSGK